LKRYRRALEAEALGNSHWSRLLNDLNSKIISDLEDSGFGSEMKSLKLFLDANWSADGNETFFDKDEAKSREYDLYASNLPKPLMRFRKAISSHSIVEQQGWWGKGIHEAFKDPNKKSRWYSAFITACKAGEHVMWREASAEDPRGSVSDNLLEKATYFLLVRPFVILDGKLFSAQLDETAEIQVEEITEASLNFRFRTEKYETGKYTVDLVTLDGLSKYIQMWDKRHHCIAEELARQSGLSNCRIKK
jgi:hypothetical protein